MREIKVEIYANSEIAKDLQLSYKGEDISATVTKLSFYLGENNTVNAIKAILKASKRPDAWKRIDKPELEKAVKWLIAKRKRKEVKNDAKAKV